MVEATEIWLNRAEGPKGCTGEVTFTGPKAWEKASAQTAMWSITAPKTGGYDKTDFKVTFADGFVYQGRLDITYHEWSLVGHILGELRFLAGDSERARLVREWGNHKAADFQKLLDTYQIGV